jgi:drug/metabolite transporter (DMT)-like permease
MSGRVGVIAWVLLLALTLIWGSSFILIKQAIVTFDPLKAGPFTAGAIRLSVAAIFLLPVALYHVRKVKAKDWLRLLAISWVGVGIPSILFPLAQTHVTSAVAGIGNSLSPFWVLVLGALFFKQRFSGQKIIGVLIGLVGAVILIAAGKTREQLIFGSGYELLLVAATFCYGLSTNLQRELLTRYPSTMISALQVSLIGLPAMILLVPATPFVELMQTHPQAWKSLAAAATLGAFGTALAVLLFSRLIQLTDAVFSSSVTYLMPIVAVIWGFFSHEQMHWLQLVGMAVILSGVLLVNRGK